MIHSITWDLNGKLPFRYIQDVKFFQKNQSIEFQDGLNILVGDNGCGKTTIVKILRHYFLEQHENMPTLNYDEFDGLALTNLADGFADGIKVRANFNAPTVTMIDPNNSDKYRNRMTRTAMSRLICKGSQGESTMMEYNLCLQALYEHNKDYRSPMKVIDGYFHADDTKAEILRYYKENQVNDHSVCMIMDEPDNSVSVKKILVLQNELDEMVQNCSRGMQVIMVLHNPILLVHFVDNPKVNFIEMTPGYLKDIRKLKKSLQKS